jgi:hypothetical protein
MSLFWMLIDFAVRYGIVAITLVFTLIVVTTYWPSRRPTMEAHGRIPLQDDR